ncbi:PAS domain S-box protein, partial [Halorhodospira sp. 9621]|uniref:hybrid sensor histidine kinase/response regulator n=1 Tax=Halorhodospira sp. 9621 TaxID=2899135 RepID=UPI001EE7EDFB
PAFEKLLGYRAEELEGTPFHDRFVPERHRAAMQAGMRYFRESGGRLRIGQHTEVEAIHRDGHEIPLELALAPVQISGRWHAAGLLRDISERRALEALREQLANLTAQLPGFIYQCQLWPDGRHAFVYANGGVEDTYGVTPETVLECPDRVFEFMYEADRDEVGRSMEHSAKTLTPWRQSFRIHHPSKGTVWLEGNSTPERQADGSTLWHGYLQDITDRVRAEQELAQNKALLEEFFNQSITGFFFMMLDEPIDWQGATEQQKEALLDYALKHQRVTKINQAMLDQYRAKEEDFIGLTFADFFSYENIEHGRNVLRDLFDQGRAHAVTHERRWDDTSIIINGDYTCLHDEQGRVTGFFGVQEDVTERRRAEQAERQLREQLEARKHDLEAIFEAAESVSLIKTDLNSVILEASTGAEALFGYNREELIGQHVSLLHTDADSERLPGYVDPVFQEHQPFRMETELVRRDGSRFPALLTIHPITNSRGELVETLGVSFDISDQKRAAQELAEAVAAKTTFLNAVSHDLRSPLNALTGFVDLLAAPDLEEEQRQSYVQQCRHASRRLLELIDSLLDLSRLQAGRLRLQPAPFDLHAAIESQCTVHRHLAEEHGLRFTSKVEPGVPQWVEADATRLGQILSNLLSNAIKYTHEGQVDLTVCADAGEQITFQVRDTGPGIPPEQQAHIFAAFDRAGYQGSRSGHGLGLAIVRELTELFGGEISLQSTPGVGSTFTVTLPLPPAAQETERDTDTGVDSTPPPLGGDAPASALNVLVADDEAVNVFLARTLLEQLGCTVTTAEDGASALEAWQTQTFDALVLDRHMPGFDGDQLAERIRAEERAQGRTWVAIALYTAYARSEVEPVLETGLFDAFLSKPLGRTELRQWIKSLVPRKDPEAATTPGETHGPTSNS